MKTHPFDDRILALSENVSQSLDNLGDVVTRQIQGLAEVIDQLSMEEDSAQNREDFDKLSQEFTKASEVIRRSLSEPNGSRTDELDLQAAAETALSQAFANTVQAQQDLFAVSINTMSQVARLRLKVDP